MTVQKSRRLSSPRLGTHGPRGETHGSIHASYCHCSSCPFESARVNADEPCPKCGGAMVMGSRSAARAMARARPQSCGVVGTRDPNEEARTNALLAAAREDAQR